MDGRADDYRGQGLCDQGPEFQHINHHRTKSGIVQKAFKLARLALPKEIFFWGKKTKCNKRKAPEFPAFPPLPRSCDIITKLIGVEKPLRDQAAQAWKQETEKASKVVESVIQGLPEPERSELSPALALAQKQTILQSKTEPDPRLAGKWITEGRTLEFISEGVVLVKGEPKGTWRWSKARSHSSIVFTLCAGQLTALGELGADSMELRIIGAETKHAMKQ
jgi:hypothetical protein